MRAFQQATKAVSLRRQAQHGTEGQAELPSLRVVTMTQVGTRHKSMAGGQVDPLSMPALPIFNTKSSPQDIQTAAFKPEGPAMRQRAGAHSRAVPVRQDPGRAAPVHTG